jgi:virginiamycin B lyase
MNQCNAIGRISPEGEIDVHDLPTPRAAPVGITSAARGMWFAEIGAGQIGCITTTGEISEFPLPDRDARPHAIVSDGQGSCWFTEWAANRIGRIEPTGSMTEFELPTPNSEPHGITIAPTEPSGSPWRTALSYAWH